MSPVSVHFPSCPRWWAEGGEGWWRKRVLLIWVLLLVLRVKNSCWVLDFTVSFNNHLFFSHSFSWSSTFFQPHIQYIYATVQYNYWLHIQTVYFLKSFIFHQPMFYRCVFAYADAKTKSSWTNLNSNKMFEDQCKFISLHLCYYN